MKPESSQVKLPPQAIIDLYRGLGMQEFFNLLGWPLQGDLSGVYCVGDKLGFWLEYPKDFKTQGEAAQFLTSVGVEVDKTGLWEPNIPRDVFQSILIKPW